MPHQFSNAAAPLSANPQSRSGPPSAFSATSPAEAGRGQPLTRRVAEIEARLKAPTSAGSQPEGWEAFVMMLIAGLIALLVMAGGSQ